MTIPTLPTVDTTQPAARRCGEHDTDTDAPATRSINYVIDPGTRDKRGATLDVCDDNYCYQRAIDYIATVGDLADPRQPCDRITPAQPAAPAFIDAICPDCGTKSDGYPGSRPHRVTDPCRAGGNPTPWRIGMHVTVYAADGSATDGTITGLNIPTHFPSANWYADVSAPAFGFRTRMVLIDDLEAWLPNAA